VVLGTWEEEGGCLSSRQGRLKEEEEEEEGIYLRVGGTHESLSGRSKIFDGGPPPPFLFRPPALGLRDQHDLLACVGSRLYRLQSFLALIKRAPHASDERF